MKKSNLYTGTGDRGTTALADGSRAPKNSPRVSAYGDLDELNAHLGLLQSHTALVPGAEAEARELLKIENQLFAIGTYLATPSPGNGTEGAACKGTSPEVIEEIEHAIDQLDSLLEPQRSFILPGGSVAAGHAHVCRTVCRRVERALLTLADTGVWIDPSVMVYINRLSDYLFILARRLNALNGVEDTPVTF